LRRTLPFVGLREQQPLALRRLGFEEGVGLDSIGDVLFEQLELGGAYWLGFESH